jgi:hypothetical protein
MSNLPTVWESPGEQFAINTEILTSEPRAVRLFKLGEALLEMHEGELESVKELDENNTRYVQRRVPHATEAEIQLLVRAPSNGADGYLINPAVLAVGYIDEEGEETYIGMERHKLDSIKADNDPFYKIFDDYFSSHFGIRAAS